MSSVQSNVAAAGLLLVNLGGMIGKSVGIVSDNSQMMGRLHRDPTLAAAVLEPIFYDLKTFCADSGDAKETFSRLTTNLGELTKELGPQRTGTVSERTQLNALFRDMHLVLAFDTEVYSTEVRSAIEDRFIAAKWLCGLEPTRNDRSDGIIRSASRWRDLRVAAKTGTIATILMTLEVLARAARGAVDTLDTVHGAIYDALASVLGDRHTDEGGAGD